MNMTEFICLSLSRSIKDLCSTGKNKDCSEGFVLMQVFAQFSNNEEALRHLFEAEHVQIRVPWVNWTAILHYPTYAVVQVK